MTLGGTIFVGTTLAVAVLDGGLSYLVGSAACGGVAYWAVRRSPQTRVDAIVETQVNAWEYKISQAPPEKREAMRKEMEAAIKKTRTGVLADSSNIRQAAGLIGLGVAMAPVAGVAILTASTLSKVQEIPTDSTCNALAYEM